MSLAGRLALAWLLLIAFSCMGACGGLIVAARYGLFTPNVEPETTLYPYPHHIPKQADGVSLRFAMVNDVVHERFPRHGSAYYKERNRRVAQALADRKDQSSEEYFALLDDQAVGLEFVGEHDEAIRVMRDKWKQQQALGMTGRQFYSTYANLGTFLILGPFRQVRPGNDDDKKVLREGLALIQKSIKVNPDAHFGREIWQAVLVEYMIALLDRPELLTKYDMIGNALDTAIDPSRTRCIDESKSSASLDYQAIKWFPLHPSEEERKRLRELITHVGAEGNWRTVVPSMGNPVPFDEPTLGIIGMWRLGGGAHPYFALALGETMLRVGQRYLAWSAYERAARMAPVAWPEKELQLQFEKHCRNRQALIESQLPAAEVDSLRPAFEKELRLGHDYQKAYQDYEQEQIAAGRDLDDPQFYDAFHASHESIASPVGPEDQLVAERIGWSEEQLRAILTSPSIILFAGLGALVAAGILWLGTGIVTHLRRASST
jgi:tetratricopeptide (TPR) repeat protein